ncbi:MAG: GNAT family N-acetyltransferase [Phenylobacterium sp.]|uniref:GNAT family N-acetyltransferase n=1 Tax=Phenylobacterium sp. TaxID=1871053 RepID=UPI0027359510|nr:GNAT family N-acetyltransferase [Phenylobacterium sp.]MDP3747625.1 GNAT family N-acetyltransferase [Phenylobacterium sp.]
MLETPRLILRRFREVDRDAFAAMNGDPRVGEWLGGTSDRAASDATLDRINAHIDEHGWGLWAAERKADGRLVGMIGLSTVKADALPVGPAVEMGWRLIPDAWGGGLATEGARAALDWGLAHIDVAEIIAFTAATNLRSQAVMARIGMVADPARDFDHPRLAEDHPLRRHVVYVARR